MTAKISKLSGKMINKPVIIIIAIIIIGGSYYWYKKTHPANTQVQYVTAAAEKGTLTTSISGSGNAIVDQQANIDPTITGTVANLAVAIGDQVKKGQFLFNIVNDSLGVSVAKATSSLLQSKNSIESAKVDKKSAQADYDSAKKKNDTTPDTYTHKELDVLKEKIDTADDGITEAEKSYAATLADYNNQLSNAAKRKVTAPVGGTVNAVNIKNGDDLSKLTSGSSRQVPMIIGDLTTIKAQIQINEVDVPNVQIGQKAMMTFNSVAGLTASGKVEKIDSLGTITQGVVIYNATIGFDTLDPRIKPGMSVSASIITGLKQDVIIVPNSAVKTQGTNNYVDVLNSGTAPQQVTVQVGAVNNTETEILSGINVGDKVVTRTINPNTTTTTGTQAQSGGFGGGAFRALH
jgi:HlyD family secretion protein